MRNWKEWYGSCFYSHLHKQYEKVKDNNLSPTRLYLRLSDGHEDVHKALSKLAAAIYDHTLQKELLNSRSSPLLLGLALC